MNRELSSLYVVLYSNINKIFMFPFQSLRPALLNVREMCYRISDMGLCRVEKGHTYTLDEFRNAQFEQLEEVCIKNTILSPPQINIMLLLFHLQYTHFGGWLAASWICFKVTARCC